MRGGAVLDKKYDVVVFGSGYAGLASILRLLSSGRRVLLVEQEPGISHKSYYGGVGLDGLVFVSEKYRDILGELGVSLKPRSKSGEGVWFYGLELMVALLYKAFSMGLDMIVDSIVEPFFDYSEDSWFTVRGVLIKGFGTDFSDTLYTVEAATLIDASSTAGLINVVIERLKLDVPMNGFGPNIPGSDEVVTKTGWLIPGVIAAGLAVSMITGSPLPFPDIGPLLASGFRAGELALKGPGSISNRNYIHPGII